jgi:hypothetical protein
MKNWDGAIRSEVSTFGTFSRFRPADHTALQAPLTPAYERRPPFHKRSNGRRES